jgi:hypothetical protein
MRTLIAITALVAMRSITAQEAAPAHSTVSACHTETSCQAGWEFSRRWVLEHASFQIRNVTPDYIATFQPYNANPSLFAAVIYREHGAGGERIVAQIWCGAEMQSPHGEGLIGRHFKNNTECSPSGDSVRQEFAARLDKAIATAESPQS